MSVPNHLLIEQTCNECGTPWAAWPKGKCVVAMDTLGMCPRCVTRIQKTGATIDVKYFPGSQWKNKGGKATEHAQPDEVVNVLQELIDVGVRRHVDATADETFTECLVCGEWEGHLDDCPMPHVLAIMDPGL